MLTYEHFISELRPLVTLGRTLYDRPSGHEDPDFRRWKTEVVDLIERMEQEKYSIKCLIRDRHFFSIGRSYTGSDRSQLKSYNQALKDTIDEMEILINRYDKYGATPPIKPRPSTVPATSEPADKPSAGSSTELPPPKTLTLDWIWRHMPTTWWKWIAGTLGAVFALGVQLGRLLK